MAVAAAETGHAPTRVYKDQSGIFHLNGQPIVDVEGVNVITNYEYVSSSVLAAAGATSGPLWVCPNDGNSYIIKSVTARFTTASSSGTMQVEVAGAAVAVAGGTNQLTGTMSLAGTANTNVNGTVIAPPTAITAGSSVNLIFAGTVTNLVGLTVTIALARVA